MASNPRYANGARRRAIRDRWRAIGAPCALCGKPIDYDLGYVTDPVTGKRRMHPMAFVVDEIRPVKYGGDPLDFGNTRPAHYICNARRGSGDRRKTSLGGALPQPFEEW